MSRFCQVDQENREGAQEPPNTRQASKNLPTPLLNKLLLGASVSFVLHVSLTLQNVYIHVSSYEVILSIDDARDRPFTCCRRGGKGTQLLLSPPPPVPNPSSSIAIIIMPLPSSSTSFSRGFVFGCIPSACARCSSQRALCCQSLVEEDEDEGEDDAGGGARGRGGGAWGWGAINLLLLQLAAVLKEMPTGRKLLHSPVATLDLLVADAC